MVMILDPKETIPVESAPEPVGRQLTGQYREWTYSMPFAGVRYYSYQPRPRLPDLDTIRPTLPVKLIDERVILL